MYIFASDAKPNEKPSNGHRTRFAAYTHTKKIILKWIFWNCAAIASPCRWQKSVPRSTKRPWSSKSGQNVLLHRYGGIPMDRCKVRSGSGRSASRTLSGTGHSRFPQQQTPLERHPYDGDLPDALSASNSATPICSSRQASPPKPCGRKYETRSKKPGSPKSNPAFASFPNQPRICRRIIRRQRKYPASDIVR